MDQLDRVLDIKSSRSAWISKAISERLDGVSAIERDLEDATVDDLLSWLLFHGAITNKERFRIANEFKDTESLRQQAEQSRNHRPDRE